MLAGAVVAASMEIGARTPSFNKADYAYQLQCMVRNLQANIMDIWEERHRGDYEKLEGFKVIL